jgi:hypothetical protein
LALAWLRFVNILWELKFKIRGGFGEEGVGDKNFFPHPNELLIWAYPE